jgi:prevent-host-death family protein
MTILIVIFTLGWSDAMERISATDAKREFGEILLKAQQGPIGIDRNGKPAAVMLSADAYNEMAALNRQFLELAIEEGMADVQAGRVSTSQKTMNRLRHLVANAGG